MGRFIFTTSDYKTLQIKNKMNEDKSIARENILFAKCNVLLSKFVLVNEKCRDDQQMHGTILTAQMRTFVDIKVGIWSIFVNNGCKKPLQTSLQAEIKRYCKV